MPKPIEYSRHLVRQLNEAEAARDAARADADRLAEAIRFSHLTGFEPLFAALEAHDAEVAT